MQLKGKTLFITGASRGIGHAIAVRAARDGANVVIAAKTEKEHPKLPGTIYSAAKDVEEAGGKALPVVCDIRSEEQVIAAVEKAVGTFGGIDICINNASALNLVGTEALEMKRYDLMHGINARGTFMVSKYCLPFLKNAENPHILNISPPLNMNAKWFAGHVAYTMAKYGMSMCTLGMAEEFRNLGIAVNSLWPETAIATAAVKNLLGGDEAIKGSRDPAIMADAAVQILARSSRACTGNFFIDVEVLEDSGISDFSKYAIEPGHKLVRDFFLDDWCSSKTPAAGNKK
ncbi:MAG: NAD(P)-dependent oxidoreductase [Candidatus Obscuribacterales bacterium]|nr:NAD(P)-dependent oxidoreductase [Candidatus Obscuribacterales bacterium]